jgi:hypothetical protein
MRFMSLQTVREENTWATTVFFVWICSIGVIINHTGGRTDMFFTFGIIPFTFSFAFGLTHLF